LNQDNSAKIEGRITSSPFPKYSSPKARVFPMYHSPISDLKLTMLFMEAGIVPLALTARAANGAFGAACHFDIDMLLATMSPEEATVARRKFRKMWRKIAAAAKKRPGKKSRIILRFLGLGSQEPNRKQKMERKLCVLNRARKKVLTDM